MTMVERVATRICQIEMDYNSADDFFVRDEATGEYLIQGADHDAAFEVWRTAVARAAIEVMEAVNAERIANIHDKVAASLHDTLEKTAALAGTELAQSRDTEETSR